MTSYAANGPAWVEILPATGIVIGRVASSYETVLGWSPQMRTARGVKAIVEPGPVPAGKRAIGAELVDVDGVPQRVHVLADIPIGEQRAEALAALADQRWQVETGGITVAGIAVPTDRDTQSVVDRIVKAFADGDITGTVDFKAESGFVALDEPAIRAIKAAGAAHIQACFSHERALAEAIASAEDTAALAAIDITSGWPD